MRSMRTMKTFLLAAVCTFNVGSIAATAVEARSGGTTPFAISTFHCLGLYWSPPGGAADKEVLVRYRRQGATEWEAGLPMRYNPIPKTDEDLADYRGSIVHLVPASTYEIQLTLAGTATTANLTAATWSEDLPAGEVIRVGDRDTPLVITDSGTPQGYRVYDSQGATIDVRHLHDSCITVKASNIILRGFTLRGAGAANVDPKRIIGAIQIDGGQDIVIEGCDISDWGRRNPTTGFGFDYDAAIYSRSAALKRLIVQRCKLHHPTFDGSTWYEPKYPTHTMGPQCITLFNTAGTSAVRLRSNTVCVPTNLDCSCSGPVAVFQVSCQYGRGTLFVPVLGLDHSQNAGPYGGPERFWQAGPSVQNIGQVGGNGVVHCAALR